MRRGFTIIELLMSMAIFAVVTAFVTANYRVGRQGDELRIGSQVLASSIRRVQTMAISGQTVPWCVGGANANKVCNPGAPGVCPSGTCTSDVPRGYGLRVSTNTGSATRMITFADIDGDHLYDPGEEIRTDAVSPGPLVSVTVLSPVDGGNLDLVFAPPKPTIWLNGASTGQIASITLRHSTTLGTKLVTVNGLTGQVSAD